MKKTILRTFLVCLFALIGADALAYDVVVENEDGVTIYYNYINNSTELEVASGYYNYYNYSDIKIPETVTILNRTRKVTSIGEQAFQKCTELTSVTIPASVTSIGSNAFEKCSGLKKVIVKDLTAWYCISFCNFYSNPLCYAHHLYSDENTEITNLVISGDVTSIGKYAFIGCSGLTSVTIPASVTSIGEHAFYGCSGLTSVTISGGVTSIGSSAFDGCSGLTSVTIPGSVTSIGSSAFYNCSGLTSLTISEGVMSIGSSAFYDCSGLTSVIIPASVTSIGDGAFNQCNNLADFVSLIQEPFQVSNIVSNFIYNNGTLYVPKGTIEKYKATDGWKEFVWMEEGNPLSIKQPNGTAASATEAQRYTIGGESINSPQRGLNIIKMSDGTVKKVMVK